MLGGLDTSSWSFLALKIFQFSTSNYLWREYLGSTVDRRLLTEGDDEYLDEAEDVRGAVVPLVEVGQVDLPTLVHMFGHLDLHVRGRLHVADGGVVGVSLQEPQRDGDIVVLAFVGDRYRPEDVDHVSVSSIVEYELVRLWDQSWQQCELRAVFPSLLCQLTSVVMEGGQHVSLGLLWVPVFHFRQSRGYQGLRVGGWHPLSLSLSLEYQI